MINHPHRRRPVASPPKKKKSKPKAIAPPPTHASRPHDYSALLECVGISFSAAILGQPRLFLTDAADRDRIGVDLNELYLNSLPAERQTHNCHACRRFIELYGGLVALTEAGTILPVMWIPEAVPDFYRPAFAAMFERVRKARVISVFHSKAPIWGTPETGEWSHIAVVPPAFLVFRERLLTPEQAMAATKENFRVVSSALAEFTAPMLDEALRVLRSEALARSEKFVAPVQWLRTLHDRPKGRVGENVLWRAIATAPEGYCHPKASVVAPLLDDIVAGLPFADIKARFEAKVHPLLYQRPQAAPAAGNIAAAEAAFEKLGLAPALERRFARIDELETIWKPEAPREENRTGGVFGHLKPKGVAPVPAVDLPNTTITWEKFERTVLQAADQIELMVPIIGNFTALTTAANPDAPPILKWANPVAWYVYHNGSRAAQWGLKGGAWSKVLAVTRSPAQWGANPKAYLGGGLVLVLEGCIDSNDQAGNALFPECLRDDLHSFRATIEAYSRTAKLGGRDGQVACGFGLHKGASDCLLRVLVNGAWAGYRIDRLD